jgi:hypothetical protein
MELNRIKFTGKITQACAKDAGRYAVDGALMMIAPGETNGVAVATNGHMLAATTILADKSMDRPFCEIAPLSAIPNWANGWMPRVAVNEKDTDPAYIARGEFVHAEDRARTFPPFEDIVEADFPEDAAVVALNVLQLKAALEAAGSAEGTSIAIVLNRKAIARNGVYSGAMQLIATGDADGPAGIAVLMPVNADLSALRRRWLSFRAMLGKIAKTIPGREDAKGLKADEILAELDKQEREKQKSGAKNAKGDAGAKGAKRERAQRPARGKKQPKALPAPESPTVPTVDAPDAEPVESSDISPAVKAAA